LDAQYKAALQQFLRGDAAAAAAFRRIVQADSSYAPAWRGLGLALAKNGSKADAAKALKKYLALTPNAADAAQIQARLEQLK
jgi:regulator of sirC expression with transglutaminase-like and TPR domain